MIGDNFLEVVASRGPGHDNFQEVVPIKDRTATLGPTRSVPYASPDGDDPPEVGRGIAVKARDEGEYREFAAARMGAIRRTAYLLCRDWHAADDLVAIALDKLYRTWPRRAQIANLDAYVRGILARAWIDERRRPWRREHLSDDGELEPDATAVGGADGRVVERMTLDGYLATLGPRRRAVIVLRFYCDLSVEDTAEVLGVSVGTVKSQTARGLETLRALATQPTHPGREP
jgi:RNA polymerase sigma-70 factor (sigma-E family)